MPSHSLKEMKGNDRSHESIEHVETQSLNKTVVGVLVI